MGVMVGREGGKVRVSVGVNMVVMDMMGGRVSIEVEVEVLVMRLV